MGKLDDSSYNYFSNLNPIAKKISRETENLISSQPEWENLSSSEKEQVIDRHFIDASESKDNTNCDLVEVFPKLKVNCGEKIVVDFENEDGWTWRDEHSGPFSWASRSQQDLTIFDLDEGEESVEDTPVKPTRKKYQTPERDEHTFKSAPRTANSNAFAGTAADEIFQKFGISFKKGTTSSDDGSASVSPQEENKLIVSDSATSSPHDDNKLLMSDSATSSPRDDNTLIGSDSMSMSLQEDSTLFNDSFRDCSELSVTDTLSIVDHRSSNISTTDVSSSELSPTRSFGKGRREESLRRKRAKQEVEQCLISDDNTSYEDHGQVSPVYVEDPGESTTDQSPVFNYPDSQPITTQPSSIIDAEDADPMVKSGFGFLDDW